MSNLNKAEAGARHELVSTSVGTARLDWFPAQGEPRAVALLGHGTATRVGVDAPPDFPASSTAAGPTLAPEELAGRKLLALFDRAAARDFADVRLLAQRFGKDVLLARAAQIDAGFDTGPWPT